MDHIWLIGMMGSGKSTVGRLLADRLNCPFYDTDADVEEESGTTVAEVFEDAGERTFRDLERTTIAEVAALPSGVVATGGGVVLDHRNVEAMKSSGTIVLLAADIEVIASRVDGSNQRPLLADGGDLALRTIADERDGVYRAAADAVVDASGSIDDVTNAVEAACSTL